VADLLRRRLAVILALPPGQPIRDGDNLFELGLDSLMRTEFHHTLEKDLGCAIPLAVVVENPTVGDLVERLLPLL
jgi:aryl carrier-like protein